MRKKAFFWTSYLLFWFAFAEVVMRVFLQNPYATDNIIIQKLKIRAPNEQYTLSRNLIDSVDSFVTVRSDSRSYLRPSFQYPKPDTTILFLGGSTTESISVKEELRFPAFVSSLLKQEGYSVNSLNLALSGASVHDSLNSYLNHALLEKPDIVVMMHATNDMGLLCYSPGYSITMARSLDTKMLLNAIKEKASNHSFLIANLRNLFGYFYGKRVQPGVRKSHTCTEVAFKEFQMRLKIFIAMTRASGAEPVLMTQPYSQEKTKETPWWHDKTLQDKANDIIRKTCDEENVILIDLMKTLEEEDPEYSKPMRYFYDGIHHTDYGSTYFAEQIAKALQSHGLIRKAEES